MIAEMEDRIRELENELSYREADLFEARRQLAEAQRWIPVEDGPVTVWSGSVAPRSFVQDREAGRSLDPGGPPAMNDQQREAAFVKLSNFISTERGWREKVFANKPALRKRKLAECAAARVALERLYSGNFPAEAPRQKDAQQIDWIPVGERLPEPRTRVLILSDGIQDIGMLVETDETGSRLRWIERLYAGMNRLHTTVTHWRPLPEPPPQEEA